MRRDGDYRNLILIRSVAPKGAISTRRAILYIGFKDFGGGIVRILDRIVFVSVQTGVARIVLQQFDAFQDLFEKTFVLRGLCFFRPLPVLKRLTRSSFKRLEGARRLLEPDQREGH